MIPVWSQLWIIAQVFGDMKGMKILDNIHYRALRAFLGVNRFATKGGLEGEMGWNMPNIRRKMNMLRMWNRIMKMEESRLPTLIFHEQMKSKDSWFNDLRNVFVSVNAIDVLEKNVPALNFIEFYNYAVQQLSDHWSFIMEGRLNCIIIRK